MKIIIFLIFIPLVYSELHTFMITYTEINGQTTSGTPEFSAVTTLDDHQIDYYDSNIKKLILKQDWMWEFASTDTWKEYTGIREKLQQIYRNNSHVLMETFTQSHGVHTYQRMYGCDWDDNTGHADWFDRYACDGEDFMSLDLKGNRYIASVPKASPTVKKWSNDREQLRYLKQYYDSECVYWLKTFLHSPKATFEKADPPKVSLPHNDSDYTSHVTGFLFRNTSMVIVIIISVIAGLITLFVLWKHRMKLKAHSNKVRHTKTVLYLKNKHLQEPAPAQDSQDSQDSQESQESLLPTTSIECPSPPEVTDSLVSGSSLFLHSDAENPFPELHLHSSSLVDRSSQLHPTTTESFYKVQETSKDL